NRDHIGSVRELVDSSNSIRGRYTYGIWGQRSKVGGDLDIDEGFTGYTAHTYSNLLVSPTRLYGAAIGRFLSRDPINESGGLNLYSYAGGDPVNHTDPLGLSWGTFTDGAWSQVQGFIVGAILAAAIAVSLPCLIPAMLVVGAAAFGF